jgi:heat shock protein HslJ
MTYSVYCNRLLFSVGLVSLTIALSATAQPVSKSWLDQPLTNWNKPPGGLPSLPRPAAATNVEACRESMREPVSAAERAIVKRGWHLFGPVQSYSTVRLIMATSGFDGMCRPMGYQAFVYVEGRYAGTLSPQAMDSRTDGALVTARLLSATQINTEFSRYAASDALCCPSRNSMVTYKIRADEVPDLMATAVDTGSTCPDAAPTTNSATPEPLMPESSAKSPTGISGRRWLLSAIGERSVSPGKPYIEFDETQRQFFGSTGCNRFTGQFQQSTTGVTFSKAASTRMACLDPRAQTTEIELLRALESVTRLEVQGNTLNLYNQKTLLLKFESR